MFTEKNQLKTFSIVYKKNKTAAEPPTKRFQLFSTQNKKQTHITED